MRYWFWPGIDSGSKDIPRGNKICMSSVFRNLLAVCKQTFSDSTFGLISGKEQGDVLYICYQQRTNVIMYLERHNIILSNSSLSYLPSLKTTSRCVKATLTVHIFFTQYELLSRHILFWHAFFFFFVDL